MVNAMVWVVRSGAPWRDLPAHYGPWKSVYTRFSRWVRKGVWRQVLDELAKDADSIAYMVDATVVRVHQDAQGARKGGPARSATPVAAQRLRFML
jgi:transposase